MSRADRQWNNWDGGATASMGKCKSAGSLNNRGPRHDPRRKTLTRTYEFTLTTTLTQAIRRAPRYQTERCETRQIAARPALRTGCAETRQQRDQGGKTGRLNEGEKGEGTKINPKNKSKSREKRLNPGDKMERLA